MSEDKWIALAFSTSTVVVACIIAVMHHIDPGGAGMFLFGTLFGGSLSLSVQAVAGVLSR